MSESSSGRGQHLLHQDSVKALEAVTKKKRETLVLEAETKSASCCGESSKERRAYRVKQGSSRVWTMRQQPLRLPAQEVMCSGS